MTNGFHIFYLIALVPILIGLILFLFNKRINWVELLVGAGIAFLISAIMHFVAIKCIVEDVECWSGRITHIANYPSWVEEYEEKHTSTHKVGDVELTTTWYTTEHKNHSEHWIAYLNFGSYSESKNISLQTFNEMKNNFGGNIKNGGKQSTQYYSGHFDGGDNNIYMVYDEKSYIYPVTAKRSFENRVKAAPSTFSFPNVPSNAPVYNWPENPNWLASDRLIGESRINSRELDRLNTRLGSKKKVNVIMINFGVKDSSIAELQRAKWLNGKKNDLVLCYGQVDENGVANWSRVFGWSESEKCKKSLETILVENKIDNSILPLIEEEIKVNYVMKDWSKFDYIQIEPPRWAYIVLFSVMLVSQLAFWLWANYNEFTKDGADYKRIPLY